MKEQGGSRVKPGMTVVCLDDGALPERPFSLDTRVEIVDKGMLVERGVLVTIRINAYGFVISPMPHCPGSVFQTPGLSSVFVMSGKSGAFQAIQH